METYNTKDIFTPTRPANDTFVERSKKVNDFLVDSLYTPGKQVVIYGHSGSGKTTLVLNKLKQVCENFIITRCMEGMTYENVIYDAFDQLNEYYSVEKSTGKSIKINPNISIAYNEIKTTFNLFELENSTSNKMKRIIPPQLTLQRLATFFGEIECTWVLEDFHKMSGVDKIKVSQGMKIFMDVSYDYPELRIIAIGAVGTARQVIQYDNEMNTRVAEIFVPLMSEKELRKIITIGANKLNLKFDEDVIKNITKISCGLAAICHQICLNICLNRRIYKTFDDYINEKIGKDTATIRMSDYNLAVVKYVEEKSDSFKSEYDKAIKIDSSVKVNKAKVILHCIIELKKDEFYLSDITRYISKTEYSITETEVTQIINEFITAERSEILFYDINTNTYQFNNIFLKAYCKLRFESEKSDEVDIRKRENKIINHLMSVVEIDKNKNLFDIVHSDDFEDFNNEVESYI